MSPQGKELGTRGQGEEEQMRTLVKHWWRFFARQKLSAVTRRGRELTLLPPAPSWMCTHTSCLWEECEIFPVYSRRTMSYEQSFGRDGCSAIHCLLWGISVSNEPPASSNCCPYTITEKPASTWPNILSPHLLIATGPYSCARGYSYWEMFSCSDKNCNTGI